MSVLLFEDAAAAGIVKLSPEQSTDMLRHHLNQALLLSQGLGMRTATHDICQILKWLDT